MTLNVIQQKLSLSESIILKQCGQTPDTTRSGQQECLYSILPALLESRAFNNTSTVLFIPFLLFLELTKDNIVSPFALLDAEEEGTQDGAVTQRQQQGLDWVVPFSELTIGPNIGRGSVGDYYHAEWRGRVVFSLFFSLFLLFLNLYRLPSKRLTTKNWRKWIS